MLINQPLPKANLCQFEQMGLEQLHNPIWVYDVVGYRIYWANSAAIKLWEAGNIDELSSRNFRDGSSQAVQQTLLGYLDDFEKNLTIDRWWRISPNGVDKHILCRFSGVKIDANTTAMLVEAQDSQLLSNYASGIGGASIVGLFNIKGNLQSCNPLFCEQFGASITNFSELFDDPLDSQELFNIADHQVYEHDTMLKTCEGSRWHRLELKHQHGQMDAQKDVIVTIIDIHDRKLRELRHVQESLSDPLTGLLNRRGLQQHLQEMEDTPFSLFYIDLDGFKPVNDSYGHAVGDTLLQSIAKTLQNDIDINAITSRLGGDEFILVIPKNINESHCSTIANDIVNKLSAPIEISNQNTIVVSASVGVARSPTDGHDLDGLLTCADAAMYMAKKRGRSRWIRYRKGMEEHLRRRTIIVQNLDEAISNNELEVHYQAIVSQTNNNTPLVEALLRWRHPQLGELTPEEIITSAEETGKIASVENWVIQRVCQDLPELRRQLDQQCLIAVNISGAHLSQVDFFCRLQKLIADNGLQPSDLLLELTENVLVSIAENDQPLFAAMIDAGFSLAIDDFGTGYSSLAYLSQIPASFVKIDKTFINNIDKDYHTVQFIHQLCEKLNMRCIAEGVETLEQSKALHRAGIDLQQGRFHATPKAL